MKWPVRAGLGLLTFLCVTLVGGWIYEHVEEILDTRRYASPGIMVPVGGHKVSLFCEGAGTPTVVMEMGSGEPAILFRPVQDQIAPLTRTCSYDRPGIGWSEANVEVRTIQDRAVELYTLLKTSGVPQPYVLVAHSYGGIIARAFMRDHPTDVEGLVLVDTAEEGFVFSPDFLEAIQGESATRWRDELMARFGVPRLKLSLQSGQFGIRKELFGDIRGQIISFFSNPSYVRANTDEGRSYLLVPKEMRRPGGFGALDGLPVIVIRHGQPSDGIFRPPGMSQDQLEGLWAEGQERLAKLSTNSEIIIAAKSGHMINLDQPDLIAESTRRVVIAVRTRVPVTQVE